MNKLRQLSILSLLTEDFPQFTVTQLSNPALSTGYGHVCQMPFVLYHPVYTFLKRILGYEPVYHHVLVLADAVRQPGRVPLSRFSLPIVLR